MIHLLLRRAGVWIFIAALVVRVGLVFALGSYNTIERTEVVNVAIALAQKGEFAGAYGPGTGTTAHPAPVYPLLLSLIFRVFGTGTAGEIAQEIFSSTIAAFTCALLPLLAVAFGMQRYVGVWAGLWLAALPVNYWSETKGSFEGALSGLALVVTCWHFARLWNRECFSVRDACATGIIAGLDVLICPPLIPVLAILVFTGLLLFRAKWRVYARYACLGALVTVALLIPWVVRNAFALGGMVITRSNLWLEVAVSNNDYSQPDYASNYLDSRVHRIHPFVNPEARAEEMRIGEIAYERKCRDYAIAWISTHPARFVRLTAARFVLFWFPTMLRPWQTSLIRFEALAGLIGFLLLCRARKNARWVLAAVWVGFPAVYYVVQAFPRYRYPMDWTFVLLGTYAAWCWYEMWARVQSRTKRGDQEWLRDSAHVAIPGGLRTSNSLIETRQILPSDASAFSEQRIPFGPKTGSAGNLVGS